MKLYYKIKNFFVYGWDDFRGRCQRFKRGWSYGDVWDIDCWFMRNIKPMLIHLRDHGIGIPNELYLDGAENEREAWEAVLTEMITLLDLMTEEGAEKHLGIADDDYSPTSYQKVNALMGDSKDRFFELFGRWFYCFWD
jgi:hypothetical protein